MKLNKLIFLLILMLWGCKNDQGATDNDDAVPSTGRGSNQQQDRGGNGKVYDRGGVNDTNLSVPPPGHGRVDRGGGVTAGGNVGPVGTNSYENTTQNINAARPGGNDRR